MQDFSIIVPTLNEAENIGPLRKWILALKIRSVVDPEIIFVDDGSQDGTCKYIDAYSGPLKVRLIRRENERGLTGAVIAGARAASSELVVVMDADLSHRPEDIPTLPNPLITGSKDMVIGSRYIHGGATPGWPVTRRISSRLASPPGRMFAGVKDPLAGFFLFENNILYPSMMVWPDSR